MDGEDIIDGMESASLGKRIGMSLFIIISLFLVQWQRFGTFQLADSAWESKALIVVIVYEIVNFLLMIIYQDRYIQIMRKMYEKMGMFLKLPLLGELLVLGYILISEFFCLM